MKSAQGRAAPNTFKSAQGCAAPITLKSAQGRAAPIIASAGVFLVALELTIVAVALPAIVSEFAAADSGRITWVFSAYNITVAGFLLLFGWVADRAGRRLIFVLGLLVLGLGSLVSGLAGSLPVLITGRVLQGIGGSMMMPASLALIMAAVTAAQRDQAIALWGAMAGLAAALGPALGGLFVATMGWRAVFLFNVPLVLLASVLALHLLDESKAETSPHQVDIVAIPAGVLAVSLLVYVLVERMPSGIVALEAVAWALSIAGLLAVFASRSLNHAHPVFDPTIARSPSFAWASLSTLPFVIGFTAWVVMMPAFFHSAWGYPMGLAGLAMVPAPLAMMLTASPAARLANRFGYRLTISAGVGLAIAGLLWWFTRLTTTTDYLFGFLPGAVLFGAGLGSAFPMLAAAAVREVPAAHYASGSAGLATCRQVAMAVGAALAIALVKPGYGANATAAASVLEQQQSLWLVCAGLLLVSALLIQLYPPVPSLRSGVHG